MTIEKGFLKNSKKLRMQDLLTIEALMKDVYLQQQFLKWHIF